MSIANYSTSISPVKTAGEIMKMLSTHGVTNISVSYDEGVQSGLSFIITTEFGDRDFSLPIRIDGVLQTMKSDHTIPRSKCTREQATRVAWRIARDWLRAQLALIEAGLAGLDEVMMPYMVGEQGQTMWELYTGGQRQIEQSRETS
ncbi:hypothetical protein [Bifidobacterium aquikefiri]|uniref:hypothetical protein n=1 Tax=Bifidobacterium aquikefiri TaxID=1653207 RepID=UPI0039ECD5E7